MTPERPAMGGPRALAGALLLALLLAGLTLWPVWRAPGTLAVGSTEADLAAHLWSMWWAGQPDPVSLVNQPAGDVEFYLLEPLNLLLAALLRPLGLVLAHNLSSLVALTVAGVGGFVLGREVSGRWEGGALGLLLLELSPASLEAHADGTGEFMWVGLPALALAATLRLGRSGGWGALALAVAAIWATAWSCWYHGLMLGLGVLAWASLTGRRALGRSVLALALGVVLLLPWVLAFRGSDLELPRAAGEIVEVAQARLQPWQLLPGFAAHGRHGWHAAALLLAGAGAWRLRRRALPALAVLALGWVLSWGSELGQVALPFYALNSLLLAISRPLHLPFHFQLLTALGLVLLAAWVRDRRLHLAAGLLLLLDWGLRPPLPAFQPPTADSSAVLAFLAEQPRALVVELPSLLSDDQEALDHEALNQVVHGQPIPRFPIFPTSQLRTEGVMAARSELEFLPAGDWWLVDRQAGGPWEQRLRQSLGEPVLTDQRYLLFSRGAR